MLINQSTEYVLGTPTKRELRKLTGRREDYPLFGGILRTLTAAMPGFFMTVLGAAHENIVSVIAGIVVTLFAGFLAAFVWVEAPSNRRFYASRLRDQNRLVTDDDILFQLVLTDPVKAALRRQQYWGWSDGVKERIDNFIKFLAPCRNRLDPEQSDFLTSAWEREHGRLYCHKEFVAVCEEAGGAHDLKRHVREIVLELRSRRAALLQQNLIDNSQQKEQNLQELAYQHAAMLVRQ